MSERRNNQEAGRELRTSLLTDAWCAGSHTQNAAAHRVLETSVHHPPSSLTEIGRTSMERVLLSDVAYDFPVPFISFLIRVVCIAQLYDPAPSPSQHCSELFVFDPLSSLH